MKFFLVNSFLGIIIFFFWIFFSNHAFFQYFLGESLCFQVCFLKVQKLAPSQCCPEA